MKTLNLILCGLTLCSASAFADAPATAEPIKVDKAWLAAPATHDAPGFEAEGVKAIYYNGPSYQGKPTRVFAWIGVPTQEPGTAKPKLPAMVLVHGGGGTAFDAWVRLWTSRGYAAIAMDTCGQVPKGKYGHWQRDEQGGPPGWGGFEQVDQPIEDQWTYHAVGDVILAHSLLRSMPQVDADRVGITGISWGGYVTCIVAGLDDRFKLAVPVYGCGYLGEDSVWLDVFKKLGPEKSAKWLSMWDPSVYLKNSAMPMLWVDGTNDFAYPLDSLQKSYRLPIGPRTLCTRVRMPHGHGGPGENPEEIHAFADAILREAKPLARITGQGREGRTAWATFESPTPIKEAELNFTKDDGVWQKRSWETIPATLTTESDKQKATAVLPEGAKVYYLNLTDERGLVISSEHESTGP